MSRSGNRLGHEYSRSHAKKAMTFTDSEASGGFGVRNPFLAADESYRPFSSPNKHTQTILQVILEDSLAP